MKFQHLHPAHEPGRLHLFNKDSMVKITVCLMLKTPQAGTVKTRLAAETGAHEACRLYRKLVEHQLRQLTHLALEIHFAPSSGGNEMRSWLGGGHRYLPQVEGDLGDRLKHAARGAFQRGSEAVLLLGGDCPDVTAALLESAATELETHDSVIGPAQDGGYYLLATKAFYPSLFDRIDWSTHKVFSQTMDRIGELGLTCHSLAELADVDDFAALSQARLSHEFLR